MRALPRRITPGDTITVTLPYSEVCAHMHVAGQVMAVRIGPTMAQLLNADGTNFSFPITHGEAGFYRDSHGLYIS